MNGQEGDYDVYGYISNQINMGKAEDDERDDNIDANAQDGGNINKNTRHTPQQIQQLENFFKECPHPSAKQKSELGQKLNLETNQIKCWFQNKRVKVKKHRIDSALNEISKFLASPFASQPSSPMSSSLGGYTSYQLDSMVNDLSSLVESPFSVQPSVMNETSMLLVSPSAPRPSENLTITRKLLLELATAAMNGLIMMGQPNSSLWKIDPTSMRETLNYEEYNRFFINGSVKPRGYVMEASRNTCLVLMDSLALVETLMTNKWINVFESIVSVASTRRLIPTSSNGPINGSLRLIEAEFHVISPLVPKRQVKFLRYCKMLKEGLWVVVDFTPPEEHLNVMSNGGSNRLPSGLIIEDMANGHSKVTWIEQAEYERSKIPQLYQLLIDSGIGLGAKRWLTTLRRHCKNLWNLSNINLAGVYQGLSSNVATEIVKLAERMTLSYYSGIIRTHAENGQNMALMSRKNMNVRGEPRGIVLSAATSVWFPVNQKTMFDFLSNKSFRGQWDMLIDVASIEETTKIRKSRSHNNYVSLLQIFGHDSRRVQVLQETWNDASGALLVYAPLETDSLEVVMRGEASHSVHILPSGFSIVPDGVEANGGGCLLTIGYQLLVNTNPFADVNHQDFVASGEKLMALTIDRIKSALSIPA